MLICSDQVVAGIVAEVVGVGADGVVRAHVRGSVCEQVGERRLLYEGRSDERAVTGSASLQDPVLGCSHTERMGRARVAHLERLDGAELVRLGLMGGVVDAHLERMGGTLLEYPEWSIVSLMRSSPAKPIVFSRHVGLRARPSNLACAKC